MFERGFCLVMRAWSGLLHHFRLRVTSAGRLAIAGLVAGAVLGLDTRRNLASAVFCFVLALLPFALLGLRFRPRVRGRRELPRFGTVGEPLPYRLLLSNEDEQVLSGLRVSEIFDDPRPDIARFMAARRTGEGLGWRWDRLVRAARKAQGKEMSLPVLGHGENFTLKMELLPLNRGRLHLGSLLLARSETLGLLNGLCELACADSVLILPRRYRLPMFSLPGHQSRLQGSWALPSSVAEAEEFQALRDYRPGDPLRLIHWKSWARSGKPVIREYQDESAVRHALVLDTFGPSGPAFEEAVSLAASFACTVETREALLDLLFVGGEVHRETVGRGHGPVERLLEVLADVSPCEDKPFRLLHEAVLAHGAELSGCLCVLLGWDEAREAFVRALAARGLPHEVFVIGGKVPAPKLPGLHWLEPGKIEEGLATR